MRDQDSSNVEIRSAVPVDSGEIFVLQRAAFVDEARLYGTPDVPALIESFIELNNRLAQSESWIAVDKNRIVGAVSLRAYDDTVDVERLMIAPDRRGEGISTRLLQVLESAAFNAGHHSLQLVVGDLAVDNHRMYEHLGWHRVDSFYAYGYKQVLLHKMMKRLVASNGSSPP